MEACRLLRIASGLLEAASQTQPFWGLYIDSACEQCSYQLAQLKDRSSAPFQIQRSISRAPLFAALVVAFEASSDPADFLSQVIYGCPPHPQQKPTGSLQDPDLRDNKPNFCEDLVSYTNSFDCPHLIDTDLGGNLFLIANLKLLLLLLHWLDHLKQQNT